jgi:hypothetical protein
MPKRRDVIAEELSTLADDLERLWRAATQDPKKEARRERMWMIVSGVLSAASTMAARKLAAKVWPILTGETPPAPKAQAQQQTGAAQPPRRDEHVEESEQPTSVGR